jgi:hypothetical protein
VPFVCFKRDCCSSARLVQGALLQALQALQVLQAMKEKEVVMMIVTKVMAMTKAPAHGSTDTGTGMG